ncbi:hypothetical protein HK105_205015 [Polyrhizophydium stewartii]|uniref:Uncharacterized protein n=1 Tax=Polyrhizophydium stewartii TaxID=2732419 RepID=A0ABR4N7B8_9FUNG
MARHQESPATQTQQAMSPFIQFVAIHHPLILFPLAIAQLGCTLVVENIVSKDQVMDGIVGSLMRSDENMHACFRTTQTTLAALLALVAVAKWILPADEQARPGEHPMLNMARRIYFPVLCGLVAAQYLLINTPSAVKWLHPHEFWIHPMVAGALLMGIVLTYTPVEDDRPKQD